MSNASGIPISAELKSFVDREIRGMGRNGQKRTQVTSIGEEHTVNTFVFLHRLFVDASAFDSAKRLNSTAFIKVEIVNEKLEPTHQEKKGSGGWGSDYDQIQRHLEKDKPCFIIFFKGRDEVRREDK